jgi:hypothetical protein
MADKDALFIAGSFTILGALIGFAGNFILQYIQRKKNKDNLVREKCEQLFMQLQLYSDYIRLMHSEGRKGIANKKYALNILMNDTTKLSEIRSIISMIIDAYLIDISVMRNRFVDREVNFIAAWAAVLDQELRSKITLALYEKNVTSRYNELNGAMLEMILHVRSRIRQLI